LLFDLVDRRLRDILLDIRGDSRSGSGDDRDSLLNLSRRREGIDGRPRSFETAVTFSAVREATWIRS